MDYQQFKEQLLCTTGFDLDYYKDQRMKRRITNLMRKKGIGDLGEYLERMECDESLFEEMLDYITINTSHFFRNPNSFRRLQSEVLPLLVERFNRLDCWSAACSNGAEPYTLSIILTESFSDVDFSILATDIDPQALAAAERGTYKADLLSEVGPRLLQQYFTKSDNKYSVIPGLKSRVRFKRHDLFRDNYFQQRFSLILCRNFFIYIKSQAKRDIARKFYRALKSGGVLFIGNTEHINELEELGFEKLHPPFYLKV